MQTRILLTGLVTVTALALAACGGTVPESQGPAVEPPPATTSPPAEPPPATTEPEPGFEHPAEPDAVVVDLSTGAGFVPVEVAIDSRPEFRLYGDGTVLARPENETFPSPPALVRYRLTPEGIQTVLAAADAAGLLGEMPDYGEPGVTDLGTTVLTVNVDGSSYSHPAYALGFEDSLLTAEQTDARRRLAGFSDYVRNLPVNAPDALAEQPAPYEPAAADVYVFEREAEPGLDAPKWPYERPPTDWPPASSDSAFGGACLTITGAELAPYLEPPAGEEWTALYTAGKKDDGTPRFWSIGIDLVLPGETGCTS
jgi:hypothetical protein